MIIGVEKIFDDHVRKQLGHKKNVADFIINHERKPEILKNICTQILTAEHKGRRLYIDSVRFSQLIRAGADIFIGAALEQKEQSLLTQAEKQRRIDESNKLENLKDEIIEIDNDK